MRAVGAAGWWAAGRGTADASSHREVAEARATRVWVQVVLAEGIQAQVAVARVAGEAATAARGAVEAAHAASMQADSVVKGAGPSSGIRLADPSAHHGSRVCHLCSNPRSSRQEASESTSLPCGCRSGSGQSPACERTRTSCLRRLRPRVGYSRAHCRRGALPSRRTSTQPCLRAPLDLSRELGHPRSGRTCRCNIRHDPTT